MPGAVCAAFGWLPSPKVVPLVIQQELLSRWDRHIPLNSAARVQLIPPARPRVPVPPNWLADIVGGRRAWVRDLSLMIRLINGAEQCSDDFDTYWLAAMICQPDRTRHINAVKGMTAEVGRVGRSFR